MIHLNNVFNNLYIIYYVIEEPGSQTLIRKKFANFINYNYLYYLFKERETNSSLLHLYFYVVVSSVYNNKLYIFFGGMYSCII